MHESERISSPNREWCIVAQENGRCKVAPTLVDAVLVHLRCCYDGSKCIVRVVHVCVDRMASKNALTVYIRLPPPRYPPLVPLAGYDAAPFSPVTAGHFPDSRASRCLIPVSPPVVSAI